MFGSTLTQIGCRIRGALQVTDGISIDPVDIEEIPFTSTTGRKTTRKKKDAKEGEAQEEEYFQTAFNSYYLVNYGLYRFEATFNPVDGAKHGITPDALAAFWAGLVNGWEYNRSAHRTGVNLRRVYVFEYPNARGVEPSHVTAARINVALREGIDEPRSFDDYVITVNEELPSGMDLSRWEDGPVGLPLAAAAK